MGSFRGAALQDAWDKSMSQSVKWIFCRASVEWIFGDKINCLKWS